MSAVELKFSIGEQRGTVKFGHAKTCKPEHTQGFAEFCVTDLAKIFGGDREKALAEILERRLGQSLKDSQLPVVESARRLLNVATASLDAGNNASARSTLVELGTEVLRWLEELDAANKKTGLF
ncbi:MAG: hypothetical protein JNK05_34785 [Myxococcales bacterium]|nr:hypothetical protein [Myxococcales bacterium]